MYKSLLNESIEILKKYVDVEFESGQEIDLTKINHSFSRFCKINGLSTYNFLLTATVQEKKLLYSNVGELIPSGCSSCLGKIKIK